jgi:hypothetical protein
VEDEEQCYVAKKEGLLASKLLRGLFGGWWSCFYVVGEGKRELIGCLICC